MRRSARLRSVMLRATKMHPWNCGSSLAICEPVKATGIVWPLRVRMTRLARLLRRLAQIKRLALALIQHGADGAADELLFAVAEQPPGGGIGDADDAIGRGDKHRIRHAVRDAVEIVLVDRRRAQLAAHALERLLQIAKLVAAQHIERPRVVALRDAIGAPDERAERPLDPASGAPAEDRGEAAGEGGRSRGKIDGLEEVWS